MQNIYKIDPYKQTVEFICKADEESCEINKYTPEITFHGEPCPIGGQYISRKAFLFCDDIGLVRDSSPSKEQCFTICKDLYPEPLAGILLLQIEGDLPSDSLFWGHTLYQKDGKFIEVNGQWDGVLEIRQKENML